MNENIDLTKVLKDCPKGTKLYSPLFGEVDFQKIRSDDENAIVIAKGDVTASFTKEGFYYADLSEECLLFPSKEQKDWSKFAATWLKKERFDPKTLQPFDKVIIRHDACSEWEVSLFSHRNTYYGIDDLYSFCTVTNRCVVDCIPYNDETKHLVGTKDEAPEFYKYWED